LGAIIVGGKNDVWRSRKTETATATVSKAISSTQRETERISEMGSQLSAAAAGAMHPLAAALLARDARQTKAAMIDWRSRLVAMQPGLVQTEASLKEE
jgi:hypothetical protein